MSGYWAAKNKACSTIFTVDEIVNYCRINATGSSEWSGSVNVSLYYNEEDKSVYVSNMSNNSYARLIGIK